MYDILLTVFILVQIFSVEAFGLNGRELVEVFKHPSNKFQHYLPPISCPKKSIAMPVYIKTKRDVSMNHHAFSFLNKFFSKSLSPVIAGGFLSGGLHAITGPDHLAAVLPSSIGHRGWYGIKLGAIWGLGHGLSAATIGSIAFIIKGRFKSKFGFIEKLSSFAESAVGFSLLAIGIIGLKENIELFRADATDSLSSRPLKVVNVWSVFANGILHGFSWDGAPSIAPALAMATWKSASIFLMSYSLGTMVLMSLVAGIVSEGSMRLGKVFKTPALTLGMSLVSSVAAMLIGIYWIIQAIYLK